jgi:multiple sugar transport system substrate-binding protein
VFGLDIDYYYGQWANEGRLAELADALGPLASLFFPDSLERATLFNEETGQKALYALPMGRTAIHLHAWESLLEQAGFTLEDIPQEWDAFWSFWCDEAQPAVRRAMGRDDIWGVGLIMSAGSAGEINIQFRQFLSAYEAHYVSRDGRLAIDEPEIRRRLAKAIDSYTDIYRKGCTPPEAVDWDDLGNNNAFLAQRVVMTPNATLTIPNALKTSRPEDYYRNTATIEWPNDASGQPLAIFTGFFEAAVFKAGGNIATAKEFVRFLVEDGWLVHWLDFAGDVMHPPMPKLLEQPFWLDTSDPHRMRSAIQFLTRPHDYDYAAVSGEWRHRQVEAENVWGAAIHRVVAEGISPEQAVGEAIARIKRILAE